MEKTVIKGDSDSSFSASRDYFFVLFSVKKWEGALMN